MGGKIPYMRRIFLLLAVLGSCTQPSDQSASSRAENVQIFRDDFGIPHVYGKTDADAVFGMIYAQCEDDFPRVERNYAWAIGRLAEYEGEGALYSDLRAQLFMTREEAIENYESAPGWLKELCDAWAEGINYYLDTHPEVQPAVITQFEPWMPMYFSEGSIGGDIERVSTRRIRAFYDEKEEVVLNPGNGLVPMDEDREPRGSNGFAISGKLTRSGNAMLLINPHTSFYFRGEMHMVSEEGLNAYGAVTWGQFFIYQGFNENTGWMHTSTYTDVIDEFVETIEERDGVLHYKYGDEWRPVNQQEVTLQYREGSELIERNFTIYRTHHGPITHTIDGQWVSTALMWEPVKALTQSYTRTKKANHDEFREMMDIRTNSSNNTVFADNEGNIAYYHGNFIPRRDVQFDYSKPLDGSDPATDWQGLHSVDESIRLLNPPNGWIQNCNSTPFTSAAENSPKVEDYPYYMSANVETFRGVHAIDVLEDANDLTLDGLIELAYDPHLPAFEALIPGLIRAYDNSEKDPSLATAIDTLRNWDFRVSANSVAMTLAHHYGVQYGRTGERPEGLTFMERYTYYGSGSSDEEKLSVFSETIDLLNNDFGRWSIPWGEVNRFQRLNGDIQLDFDDSKESLAVGLASGRWGALASYGARRGTNTKKIYGTSGNSFVAVVEFGERVKAKSLLAGGQSGDPASPHFYDQAQRYVDRNFKDVPFYRDDVERRAVRSYSPGY